MTIAVQAEIRSGCRIVGAETLRAIGRVLLCGRVGLTGSDSAADNGACSQAADQRPGAAAPAMIVAMMVVMTIMMAIILNSLDR